MTTTEAQTRGEVSEIHLTDGGNPETLIESFSHDADGNMTTRTDEVTDEVITYQWNDFDKLVKASSAISGVPTTTAKVDNRFDVNGIRKRKIVNAVLPKVKGGEASSEYTIDIATSTSKGTGTSTLPTISYIQGHQILGYEENGNFRFFLTDHLSSVRDIVDDTGTVIKSMEYSEYGDLLNSSGSGTNSPKTWVGGLSVNDDTADSGLHLMGHRHYLGSYLGRFISRDPIGFNGSSLNLYSYPTNPVDFVDPEGLRPLGYDPTPMDIHTEPQSNTNMSRHPDMRGVVGDTLAIGTLVVLAIEGLPVAGYVMGRLGLNQIGGCLTGAGLEAGSALFGSTMLHHGSRNAPSVRQNGLRSSGSRGAFVSPQKAAAENAINRNARGGEFIQRGARKNGVWNNDYVIPESNLGVVNFKIPNNQMRRFPTSSGEYEGWGGKGLGWQQIEVSDKMSLWILNQGMCK